MSADYTRPPFAFYLGKKAELRYVECCYCIGDKKCWKHKEAS